MSGIDFIQDFAVILLVAAIAGWVCHHLRLSAVVGYLAAGMVVGPFTPPLSLVQNVARIETLAQVGLVFLVFSIGLRLSLRKLRRLGFGLFIAVMAATIIIYYLTRLMGAGLGLNGVQSTFLAAMLMVSSSAIISKVLQETGTNHERPGQLALGLTVLEAVVAVAMLTILNSYVQFGTGARAPLGETLGMLSAFVVLAGISGLLIVPWLLRRMSVSTGEEFQTLGLAALLFCLAIIAQRAGYSLALGAFLLGMIVAETPHRHQIERTFEGMRDIFTAVFFVAVGMQTDLRVLAQHAPIVLGLAVFALVVRAGASTVGLTLIGTPPRDAMRVGLTVTPIGEFSFIIAQLGVSAALIPTALFPAIVGVSLLTTLAAPPLTRNSHAIASFIFARQPRWLADWVRYYNSWFDRLHARQKRNLLWQLSKKRIIQVSVWVLFVSGLLIFSERLLEVLVRTAGRDLVFPEGLTVVFWVVLSLLVLAPLVAIWRNVSAMCLLYAQVATHGMAHAARLASVFEAVLKIVAGAVMYLWISSLLPSTGAAKWLVIVSAAVAVGALLVLRRKLIYWHSEMEVELQGMLADRDKRIASASASAPWLRPHGEWNLNVSECVLPDLADCQGKTIGELGLRALHGCTVVGIERQGYMISLPGPDAVLYPRDKVLLLGTADQVNAGKEFLTHVSADASTPSEFEDIRMELIEIPPNSRVAGTSLLDLSPAQTHQIQIAGILRGGVRMLTPKADEILRAGDAVLALGTPERLREFESWIREESPIETSVK